MKARLEQAQLTTDLDGQFHDLLNINELIPPPPGLVTTSDPRLSDARKPLEGSVTDDSVSDIAAIDQSKLNLNGLMPPAWFGNTATTAARGDLAEMLESKAQALGYASLDGAGKLPLTQLPLGAGSGTVTSIGITMPAQFSVTGSPVTVAGVIDIDWNDVPDGSWFGNDSGLPGPPTFQTTPLPVSLIPGLPASRITSGVFLAGLLPIAIGVGVSHAPGAVPDPGATGDPTDYLARDMTFKRSPALGPSYQPVVPDPILTNISGVPPYTIKIESILAEVKLFYSIDNPIGGFAPLPVSNQVVVGPGRTVYAYGARVGFTNSRISFITTPNVPPTELVTTGMLPNPNEPVTGDDDLNVTVGP